MAAARKTAAPVEPEEIEDEFEDMDEDEVEETEPDAAEDDDDLEEVDETPKPKKTSTKKAAAAGPKFGSQWLAEHVTEVTGETFNSRGVRMLLRKLAADGKHNRVVGETRDRYSFSGPQDATVKAVVSMVKSGEAKQLKQAGLDKVKEAAEAKKAAKKAAAAEAEADMEEVDEEPKPRTRRVAAAKPSTAPAKATPSTRRRAAAK
jgi:hypothetical protein